MAMTTTIYQDEVLRSNNIYPIDMEDLEILILKNEYPFNRELFHSEGLYHEDVGIVKKERKEDYPITLILNPGLSIDKKTNSLKIINLEGLTKTYPQKNLWQIESKLGDEAKKNNFPESIFDSTRCFILSSNFVEEDGNENDKCIATNWYGCINYNSRCYDESVITFIEKKI